MYDLYVCMYVCVRVRMNVHMYVWDFQSTYMTSVRQWHGDSMNVCASNQLPGNDIVMESAVSGINDIVMESAVLGINDIVMESAVLGYSVDRCTCQIMYLRDR